MKADTNSYSSLLMPLINEKLPTDIRVTIARKFESEVWGFKEMIGNLSKHWKLKQNNGHYLLNKRF